MTTALTAPFRSNVAAPSWAFRWKLFWARPRQTPEDLAFAAGERAGFLDEPREPDPALAAARRNAWFEGYDAGHMAATHW